ncbi:hypothetical protein, partial [Bordetella muralis]|uniref:hypothetical protein n=1 Tax=Bordetella muralis TaxID=1649130 RepID=UPI0039F05305
FVVKERVLHLRRFRFASATVSAAEKRDYEGFFSRCQIDSFSFRSERFITSQPPGHPSRCLGHSGYQG